MSNDVSVYQPNVWAMEGLLQLENNMVAANLVHRDFSTTIAKFGQSVNIQRPSDFTAVRKVTGDDVTIQDATGNNVNVTLNHLAHTTFMIYDDDNDKSMKDLITEFMVPAGRSLAQYMDLVILSQVYQFLGSGNTVGDLNTAPTRESLVDIHTRANVLKFPNSQKFGILTPRVEGSLLRDDNISNAQYAADAGMALREAWLGRKYGFDLFMDQNTPSIAASTNVTGAINNSGGYAAGSTALTVDGFSAAISNGSYVTIAGDDRPRRVSATTGAGTPTVITLTEGLDFAVANDAVVTVYTPGALTATYASGYVRKLAVSGTTPTVGQLVAFGTATAVYAVIAVESGYITVDRPLDSGVSSGDKCCYGPAGDYSLFANRNAIALVSRPLSPVPSELGVRSGVINANGVSIRATVAYNSTKQGTQVTLDSLFGVKVLNANLGIPLLSKRTTL
jgi:hypothetical protein